MHNTLIREHSTSGIVYLSFVVDEIPSLSIAKSGYSANKTESLNCTIIDSRYEIQHFALSSEAIIILH